MAIPVVLRPEDCVSAGPGEVVELGLALVVLAVVLALCSVSILSKLL